MCNSNTYMDSAENSFNVISEKPRTVMYKVKTESDEMDLGKMEIFFEFQEKTENDAVINTEVKAVMISELKELLQKNTY